MFQRFEQLFVHQQWRRHLFERPSRTNVNSIGLILWLCLGRLQQRWIRGFGGRQLARRNTAKFTFQKQCQWKCMGQIKIGRTVSNRSAIGTIVRCKATINGNSVWQTSVVSTQTGYCSQNSLVVHFGLGNATSIDSLQITWPSGASRVFDNLNVNQFYSHVENGTFEELGMADPKEMEHLINIFPNPSNGVFKVEIAGLIGESGTIEIFDLSGRLLLSKPIEINANKWAISIDEFGANISDGTYIVKVLVNQIGRFSGKVVVVK